MAPNMPNQGRFELPARPPELRTVFGELPGSRIRSGIPAAKPEIQTDFGRACSVEIRVVRRIRSGLPAAEQEIQSDLGRAYSGPRL